MVITMSGSEYINKISDIVLDAIGVGSFVLDTTLKKYIKRIEADKISKIITDYDLCFGSDELVEKSIQDLISKNIIIRSGKSIQRPSATRSINHRN